MLLLFPILIFNAPGIGKKKQRWALDGHGWTPTLVFVHERVWTRRQTNNVSDLCDTVEDALSYYYKNFLAL